MDSLLNRRDGPRYAQLLLLGALCFFLFNLGGRLVLDRLAPPVLATQPPPAPIEASSDAFIERQQAAIRRNPDQVNGYAQLGLALLEKVRITNDPALYLQAENAFTEALSRDPQFLDALIGQGMLALSRHEFTEALEWAEQAWALNPYRAETLGIKVDAFVELGRYEEAQETVVQMLRLRPGVPSYSRASYVHELHGDIPEAIRFMQLAVDAGVPGTEARLWTQVYLGHLSFHQGDLEQAEIHYQEALRDRPDYIHALAAVAQVQAARGQHEQAIAVYHPLVERLPLPEFAIALGELYEVTGRPEQAEQQYALVRVIQQLNADAGMNVDLELALFDADHGADPAQALARARAAYEARPSLYAADALAWTLYQQGDYDAARRYSEEALRLGTRDAALFYRAGKIALAAGDEATARRYLAEALAINPYFSVRHAPDAQRLLAELD